MKRLAVFLDGTWNDPVSNTNVWRLKEMLACKSQDGAEQRFHYHEGVGCHWYDRFRGGAFGDGLYLNVEDGYKWLMENYEDGDAVYLFGFSRGAYTARSLAGMIARCGLLKIGSSMSLPQVYELYERGDQLRPLYHLEYLQRHGSTDFKPEERLLVENSRRIPIRMTGVWDTVGALGIPAGIFTGINRGKYGFLNTRLSNIYEYCCHALAIDENRQEYDATLWTRFIPKAADDPLTKKIRPDPIVEQRWFAGAHANVGGGYPNDPLAMIPLEWMRSKATEAGLAFKAQVLLKGDEHTAPVTDSYKAFLKGAYGLLRSRLNRKIQRPQEEKPTGNIATVNEVIDPSVVKKWIQDPTYRPQGLVEWEKRTGNSVASLPH